MVDDRLWKVECAMVTQVFHHGKEIEDIATYEIHGSCDRALVY